MMPCSLKINKQEVPLESKTVIELNGLIAEIERQDSMSNYENRSAYKVNSIKW